MKRLFHFFCFAIVMAVGGRAAETPTKPDDAYTRAVTAYVEAANREMVALHGKVDALAKKAADDDKAQWQDIKRQLDVCDDLLESLTTANRTSFDRVKSAYERERAQAWRAIDELTKKQSDTKG